MRRLFWDLEVSPNIVLAWRIGRKVNLSYENIIKERAIISVAYKWQGGNTESITWDDRQNDKSLLRSFIPILNEADESVAHFGDSFDLKWLKARALFHDIPTLHKYITVDTCKLANQFYLNSRKLDYIAQFLGIGEKLRTESGLWKRVVMDKCPESLEFMAEYNRADVDLLEKVWERLSEVTPHKVHAGVLAGHDKWSCPRCESEKVKISKTRVTATGYKLFQFQCRDCGGYYSVRPKAHEDYLNR